MTWDINSGTAGVQDGTGTWSTGGGNWLDESTGTNTTWPSGTGTIAEFGNGTTGPSGTSRTITVSGTVGVAGMVFNPSSTDAAYIFNAGTIQFADGARIELLNGSTSSSGNKRVGFNSVLAGSNVTIAKVASTVTDPLLTTVQLFGNNTWTGTLTLVDELNNTGEGMFVQVSANGINHLDKVVVGDRVTLGINQAADYTVAMEIGVGSGARGAIRFDAAGVAGGPAGGSISGQITLRGDASISTNATATVGTVSGNIVESKPGSALTINSAGGGTIILSGNNSFTGGVIINPGTLRLGSTGALNSSAPNVVTFGPTQAASTGVKVLQLNGNSVAVGGLRIGNSGSTNNFVENASATAATLTIKNRLNNYTFAGVIRDGTGGGSLGVTKTGTGTQALTGANTYTGNTTVAAGTLTLNFANTVSNVVNATTNSSTLVTQGGTLRLEGGATVANSQRFNGLRVESGLSTIQLVQNATTAQSLLLSLGNITRTGGYVNFVLPSGTQNAVNGITTTNAAGLLGTWATVNGEDWAAVDASGNIGAFTGYQNVTNFSSGAGANGTIPDSPTAHVKIIDGGTSGNVVLADANGTNDIASLVVDATGPTVIEINNYSDPGQGTLRLGTEGAIMLAAGAGALTIGDEADLGGFVTAGGPTDNTAGNLVFYNYSSNAITMNADIVDNGSGAVTLVKNGPGLLVLNNTYNTYTGGTVFNGGTVQIKSDFALGAAPTSFDADNLTFNGGALQLVPKDSSTSFVLDSNRGITLLGGGGTITVAANTAIYNGIISGTGDFIKNGGVNAASSQLYLGGANTYTGETIVQAGTLVLTHNQALGSTAGGTSVANGAMLRLTNGLVVTGETLTINGGGNNQGALNLLGGSTAASATSATWAGDIVIGTANSRIGVDNFGTLNVAGVIRDGTANSIHFRSAGNGGVVMLSNNNTYTGTTGIVRGTLKLGVDNALPTGTILTVYTVSNLPTEAAETTAFDLNGYDQTIAGLNSVAPLGNIDVVSVTNSDAANLSTLTVDQATNQIYNGKITGNLALTKSGVGKLTLTNTYNEATPTASTSTYTGKTTISGGTLALVGTGNIEGTPWIQIDQGGTFDVAGRTGGGYNLTNKVVSGSGTVTGNLTISGTSVIRPGGNSASATLAQAGSGTGTLTINGDLTLATGGTRSLLQLGGTNSSLFDPLSGGNAEYFDNTSGGGRYDQIDINGTLNLSAGGAIKVEFASGFFATYGDVFNLLDWMALGAGNTFTLADLDLSAVSSWGNGLHFETDKFLSHGIIYVAVPEPSKALLLLTGVLWCGFRRRRRVQR